GQFSRGSGATGECEEDIIQGGPAQRQVIKGNLRGVEFAYDSGQQLRSVCHRHDEATAVPVDLDLARTEGSHRFHSAIQVASTRHCKLKPLATDLGFQFVGCTIGNYAPLVHDGDLISKLIGFLQVLCSE